MHPNKNSQQSPWQRRRQQRRQQDDQLAIERKQALDASAPRLRNLFIFVQVFLLYVVVSIVGVDDRDLLDPNSMVPLPLLNISVPTFYFFLLAPALVALLHINLLLHHQAYANKLRLWRASNPQAQLDQLAPNFFDIAFLTQGWLQRGFVRLFLWLLLYFWPPAALCLALFWFADYQHLWVSLAHLILLLIASAYSAYFAWRQNHLGNKLRYLWAWLWGSLLGLWILFGGYFLISFWFFDYQNPLLALTYITLLVIGGGTSVYLPWSKTYASGWLQNIFHILKGLLLGAVPLLGCYFFALVILLTKVSYERSDPWFDNYLPYRPNIDAPSFIHQDLESVTTIDLASAYESNTTNAELIKKYSQSLDLRERSLRYANLASGFLPKARLATADLAGANLSQASLQGADLSYAQLLGAFLLGAQLQGTYLGEAQLQGAYLSEAQLQGAYLGEAQLQGAYLWQAQLQGAYLGEAQLQGAYLWQAQLQGADLWQSQLQGAVLWEVQLHGASLWQTQLQGANLSDAQLQGTFLWQAQLQGANLSDAQLHGASLWQAQLQGAWSASNTVSDLNLTGNSRKNLLLFEGFTSDLSGVDKQILSAAEAESIIAELEEVKQLDDLSNYRRELTDTAIARIRAAIGKPWTLEGSGAITGVLTQEMIDEILEQWDD